MDKLKFYDVDKNYIDYLRKYEIQIPNFNYESNDKFVCGIVLSINELNYFAPISSFNKQQRTNLVILDKKRAISSLRFSFMFPVPEDLLKLKDFSDKPQSYRDLVNAEIKFCNNNRDKICKKAKEVYKIGTNKKHPLAYTCCNFRLLEEKCLEYMKSYKEIEETREEVAITRIEDK